MRPHELLAPDAKAFEEAPPTPGHPSDLPRSKRGVKLDDSLPHFGFEEELLAAREPEKEPGDEPLTSEDEEWTPSLREKLQQEANSEKHQLTHFPKNRYCEICRRAKMTAKGSPQKGSGNRSGKNTSFAFWPQTQSRSHDHGLVKRVRWGKLLFGSLR